jgi:2-phosphoglycolate phosphatase
MMPAVRLVLLDLDGTLADTAPDLAAAVNRMRIARGIEPLPVTELRPYVSHGARGMVRRAFDVTPDDARYQELRDEFLREYEAALCVDSALFPGMDDTLQRLEQLGVKWGIVTNKLARYTLPLVQALQLSERAACVVSGDTTPFSKPNPAPLLHALAAARADAAAAIYVGDDRRDIDAGRAAGMRTIVASYGYLGNGVPYQDWGEDDVIHAPQELLALLAK